jgi:uncharacterized protein YoaH (UPF0181 family)
MKGTNMDNQRSKPTHNVRTDALLEAVEAVQKALLPVRGISGSGEVIDAVNAGLRAREEYQNSVDASAIIVLFARAALQGDG